MEPPSVVPVSMLVVWCPDWPVVAARARTEVPAEAPAAVFDANRVVACSAPARLDGVRRGMRRRDAQSRCPELAIFPADPDRDARLFEPVACAVEDLAAGVEVVRPGLVAVPAKGPVGYFGGPTAAAERLIDHVAAHTGVECQIGIADGMFAAALAAHRAQLIAPGSTPEFLAPLGIAELSRLHDSAERSQLVDLLRRLGIRTLGAFSNLAERDVASRFGADGLAAHRLAAGRQERPPARRRPPPDWTVTQTFDPPVERVDAAAFAGRALAARLHAKLAEHSAACIRLSIEAVSEAGEERVRVWRSAEPLTAAGIADRIRWQLEGWLRGNDADGKPTAGICRLRVEPVEIVDGAALQLRLGVLGVDDNNDRAARAMVRVQGLLGAEAVCTPVLGGGRDPSARVRLVPWGDELTPAADPDQPWPGRLPAPSPTVLPRQLPPVAVFDATDTPVTIAESGELSGAPSRVAARNSPPRAVVYWAGPWPADERWWAPTAARCDRLQVVLSDGDEQSAVLLRWENAAWAVEGSYR